MNGDLADVDLSISKIDADDVNFSLCFDRIEVQLRELTFPDVAQVRRHQVLTNVH